MLLPSKVSGQAYGLAGITFPILLAAVGVLASIIGTLFVRTGEGANPHSALRAGTFGSSILVIIATFFLSRTFFGELSTFWATLSGLIAGTLIGMITEYYTSGDNKPVQNIAKSSQTGPATNIISGLAVGMKSTALPIIAIAGAILIAYNFAGLYGITGSSGNAFYYRDDCCCRCLDFCNTGGANGESGSRVER